MKKLLLIGLLIVGLLLPITASAGVVFYEKNDIRVAINGMTTWIGQDIKNDETVAGVKTSLITYSKFPVDLNLDAGIIGELKDIDSIDKIDGLLGFSVTLPDTLQWEWHGEWLLDVGYGYSPDWLVGPERHILYGGVTYKFD